MIVFPGAQKKKTKKKQTLNLDLKIKLASLHFIAAALGVASVLSVSRPPSWERRHFHRPALRCWTCSAKELTLLFLYSSLPRQPSTQPAAQPAIQLSTQPSVEPASQPGWPCPAQNWQPAGVIRVSALLACPCAKIICKHQAGTCKFIDLHSNQRPDNQIIYLHKRKKVVVGVGGCFIVILEKTLSDGNFVCFIYALTQREQWDL